MITKVMEHDGCRCAVDGQNRPLRRVAEYYGLSTDEKPAGAGNADVFYEMDTKKVSLFDEAGGIWVEQ